MLLWGPGKWQLMSAWLQSWKLTRAWAYTKVPSEVCWLFKRSLPAWSLTMKTSITEFSLNIDLGRLLWVIEISNLFYTLLGAWKIFAHNLKLIFSFFFYGLSYSTPLFYCICHTLVLWSEERCVSDVVHGTLVEYSALITPGMCISQWSR